MRVLCPICRGLQPVSCPACEEDTPRAAVIEPREHVSNHALATGDRSAWFQILGFGGQR